MSPESEKVVRQLVVQRRLFIIINVVAALSIGLLFHFITNQNAEIQKQRRDFVIRACTDQNHRHDATIKQLDKVIEKLPPDRKARAEATKTSTVLLINALAPKFDCEKIADLAVR